MQHKYLLRYIRDEMLRQHIDIKNNEAFFRLFMPEGTWDSYRSNLSNWLSPKNPDGYIRNRTFLAAVNDKLGLDPFVWNASEETQKREIAKGVASFKAQLRRQNVLSRWLDTDKPNPQQQSFLKFAATAPLAEIENLAMKMQESFARRSANQSFLISLFNMMYKRGAYQFVYERIFPALLDTYDNSFKAKKAHIYASIEPPMYREAFDILSSIEGVDVAETIDLQTAAISNIRRERFTSGKLDKSSLIGLLEMLIVSYTEIYTPHTAGDYYPALNLAYTLSLVEHLFPDHYAQVSRGWHIRQLYMNSELSLANAKRAEMPEERYHAFMSDIEFRLLLKQRNLVHEAEYLLETLSPARYLIDRTTRQMRHFYCDILRRFGTPVPPEFDAVLTVIDAYTKTKE